MLNSNHVAGPDFCNLMSRSRKFVLRSLVRSSMSGSMVSSNPFGYRLVKAFDRYVRKDHILKAKDTAAKFGLVQWTPKQFPFPCGYYKGFVTKFFQTPLDLNHPGRLWRDNCDKCPDLPRFITMFREQVMTNAEAINLGTASRSNLSKNEKELLNKLKEYQISFNVMISDIDKLVWSCTCSSNIFNSAYTIYDDKCSYKTVALSRKRILEMLLEKLTKMLRPYCQDCPAIQQLSGNFLK